MTSEKKIRANRENSKKSRGPRTAAGKEKSSRNALRHGLSLIGRHNPRYAAEIDLNAQRLCEGCDDAELRHHALVIAEAQTVLDAVRDHVVLTVDRFRDPTVLSYAKGMKGPMKRLRTTWRRCKTYDKIEASFKPKKRLSRSAEEPVTLEELLGCFWGPSPRAYEDALCAALPDLGRLGRYTRRAWSRRRRAIQRFIRRRGEIEKHHL